MCINVSDKALFTFAKAHKGIKDVLADHGLASLGDAYINFAYSLALSSRKGEPTGAKVKGIVLAEALKRAGLRDYLPSRVNRHKMADAAEALIVYAWLHGFVTLEECVSALAKAEDLVEGLSQLLMVVKSKIRF